MNDEIYQDLLEYWKGKVSPGQEERIRRWLSEAAGHEACFKKMYREYCRVSYSGKYGRVNYNQMEDHVLSHLRDKKSVIPLYVLGGVGAVACFLLFAVLLLPGKVGKVFTSEISPVFSKVPNVTLFLDNGEKIVLTKDTSFVLETSATSVERRAGGGLRYVAKENVAISPVVKKIEYNILRVPRGAEYMLTLTDGTRVWLNSETELRFPVRFEGATREVEIAGEGYFEVARDTVRPFVVCSGELKANVLGTSFNMKVYRDEISSEVTLVSGKLLVTSPFGKHILEPGWQAVSDREKKILTVGKVPVDLVVSWKSGMFDFQKMPLDELSKVLERWYNVKFVYENEMIRHICFSGTVKRSKSLKFMLDFIEETSNVQYKVRNEIVYLNKK